MESTAGLGRSWN